MILDLNNAALKQHIVTLERLHRSALPVVIRQTLTQAAFDVKQNTMPGTSRQFVHRKPTFFMANSKAVPATGFNINNMVAIVGFRPKMNDKSHSVEDLEQQEDGGAIHNRSFIALASARVGEQWQRLVRAKNRMGELNGKIFDTRNSPAGDTKEGFIEAAIEAAKTGGLVIGNRINQKGNKMAYRIDHINRFGGNTYVVATPVFAVKAGRKVHPKATHFMRIASIETAAKMEGYFIINANKKIAQLTP